MRYRGDDKGDSHFFIFSRTDNTIRNKTDRPLLVPDALGRKRYPAIRRRNGPAQCNVCCLVCACVVRVLKKITIPEMSIYGCERAFLLSVTVVFMQISVDQRFFMGTFSGRAVLQCVLVNINLINQHTWSGGRLHSLKNRKTTEFSVAINFPL